ncbi:unnamed protein product [Hydatigera taeniaeformis]|uniref:C2H2-type domain-containing protein n=1 Tax=Hydatigena taeniaeformis TaxID=6205 RepID=A0A3P7FPX9_HYDTA|nr:unnamed protein product [Hydatigera taeniaeformis]
MIGSHGARTCLRQRRGHPLAIALLAGGGGGRAVGTELRRLTCILKMVHSHRRGVLSASILIPTGTCLGSASFLCFKCFFAALTETRNDDRAPLVSITSLYAPTRKDGKMKEADADGEVHTLEVALDRNVTGMKMCKGMYRCLYGFTATLNIDADVGTLFLVPSVVLSILGNPLGTENEDLPQLSPLLPNFRRTPSKDDDDDKFNLLDMTLGSRAVKSGSRITHNEISSGWLSDIRPAQNCYEQNVEITRPRDKVEEPVATLFPFCEYHDNQESDIGPLRFQALKDIPIGSELLAWPDLLLGLSIGLPFLTIQHIKSPTCYCCPECGLDFAQPNALKSHLFLAACGVSEQGMERNIQTGTLRYTCTFCGRRYARRYSLVIHQRTHTGHKPLACRVCARRFGDPSNLNKHLRTHGVGVGGGDNSGVRNPYVCGTCGNISARRRDFERHMKRKHEAERS